MIPAAPFSLDARQIPEAQDLTGAVGDDSAQVSLLVTELLAADAITKIVFTAKLKATDADNAPTTIQYTGTPGGANVTVVAASNIPGGWLITVQLTAADLVKLETPYIYDVGVWVLRTAVTYRRTVQIGKLSAIVNVGDIT